MYQSVTGVALRTIKHSDRNSILSLWTTELGRISVTVPADSGRRSARTRALTMPLSPLCLEVDLRPDRSIYNFRELRPAVLIPGIGSEPAKAVTAMFLADFLEVCLRDQQPDRLMSDFIIESIGLLDTLPREAALNFHIYFLLRLARFFGIEPDWSEPGTLFDLRDGCFRLSAPLHSQFLNEASTTALRALSRMNTRNLSLYRFSRTQRRDILNHLLLYYSLHHRPVLSLPSMAVIAEM